MSNLVLAKREVVAEVFAPNMLDTIKNIEDACAAASHSRSMVAQMESEHPIVELEAERKAYDQCMMKRKPFSARYDAMSTYAYTKYEPTAAEIALLPHFTPSDAQRVMHARAEYVSEINGFTSRFHVYPCTHTPEMNRLKHIYDFLAIQSEKKMRN